MPTEILRLSDAARRLGIATADIVRMVHERTLEYVVVDGIVRISDTVVEDLKRQKAS